MMMFMCCCLLLLILVVVTATSFTSSDHGSTRNKQRRTTNPCVYSVDEYSFATVLDHYRYHSPVTTFALRYFVNQEHWNNNATTSNTGPVLFYAGNEANIFQFINNSGFLFEAAVELQAMVVFAEHRYYGESIPSIPDDSSDKSSFWDYLSVEQAMMDFNSLTVEIRQKWNMSSSTAFIVMGGSYGANLALWLRLKNPNIWAGAIASSATPLKHLLRETNDFTRIETEAYGNVSEHCPDLVRRGWKELYENAAAGDEGRAAVAHALSLCQPLPNNNAQAVENVHGWISNALETMVQYGYPYPTSFYNPLPAFPFIVACHDMLATAANGGGTIGLRALRAAARIYYNYTGQAGPCFDFDQHVVPQAVAFWQRNGQHDKLLLHTQQQQQRQQPHYDTDYTWGYQTCTEVYQPMPTNGVTDFEIPFTPNQTAYYEDCQARFGVQPRPNWEELVFMGSHIQAGSKIFLTNGQFDPWRAAGIQSLPKGMSKTADVTIRLVPLGAHHLDLRASHPMDPLPVQLIRMEEIAAMKRWIAQWYEMYSDDDGHDDDNHDDDHLHQRGDDLDKHGQHQHHSFQSSKNHVEKVKR